MFTGRARGPGAAFANPVALAMKLSRKTRIALLLVLPVITAVTVGAFLLLQRGRDESLSASTSLPDLE